MRSIASLIASALFLLGGTAAEAANAPPYLNSAGVVQESVGIVCISPAGAIEDCVTAAQGPSTAPTYLNSAGQRQDSIGVVCVDPVTSALESCAGGGASVGSALGGGTASTILYVDSSGNIANAKIVPFGTVTTDNPFGFTQTWNAAGVTFTGLKVNVTDTASAAASLLMDLQVGGASKFNVSKAGRVASGAGSSFGSPQFYDSSINPGSGFGILNAAASVIYGNSSSVIAFEEGVNGVRIGGAYSLGWTSGHATVSAADVRLYRDAAATLAQRNGPAAQTFNLYKSWTDASNYERVFLGNWTVDSGYFALQTAVAGTGTARGLIITTTGNSANVGLWATGTSAVIFATGNTERWNINSSGHFIAPTDNTYDIGAAGAARPRNVYVATAVVVGGDVTVGAGSRIIWNARSGIYSPSDGVLQLVNQAASDFNRLQFGGTTSSFPALKRSAAILVARLADDSANAAFEAATIDTNGFAIGSLPTPGVAGRRAYVTDQITACPLPGVAPTNGGALVCPVFDNGAAWVGGFLLNRDLDPASNDNNPVGLAHTA